MLILRFTYVSTNSKHIQYIYIYTYISISFYIYIRLRCAYGAHQKGAHVESQQICTAKDAARDSQPGVTQEDTAVFHVWGRSGV